MFFIVLHGFMNQIGGNQYPSSGERWIPVPAIILTDVMYVVKRFVVCGYRFEAVATTVPLDQLLGLLLDCWGTPRICFAALPLRRARRRHCFRRRRRCRRCPSPSPRSPLLLPPSSPVLSPQCRCRCHRCRTYAAHVMSIEYGLPQTLATFL